MQAKSAALGTAVALAFSNAAVALPCADKLPAEVAALAVTCMVSDKALSPVALGRAAAEADRPSSTLGQSALLLEAADSLDAEDGDPFVDAAVKITNLQATMTSNRYVASPTPFAPRANPAEDLTMYGPDYLSLKLLPRVPQRKPVGVGLVTVPRPPAKKPEAEPGPEWPRRTVP